MLKGKTMKQRYPRHFLPRHYTVKRSHDTEKLIVIIIEFILCIVEEMKQVIHIRKNPSHHLSLITDFSGTRSFVNVAH